MKFKVGDTVETICCFIWWFSEKYKISLGKLAPILFNGMIGCYKSKKVEK